jgi:hypothetical protein
VAFSFALEWESQAELNAVDKLLPEEEHIPKIRVRIVLTLAKLGRLSTLL